MWIKNSHVTICTTISQFTSLALLLSHILFPINGDFHSCQVLFAVYFCVISNCTCPMFHVKWILAIINEAPLIHTGQKSHDFPRIIRILMLRFCLCVKPCNTAKLIPEGHCVHRIGHSNRT